METINVRKQQNVISKTISDNGLNEWDSWAIMCHRNQVEKGKDMDIIKKYKWYILPLAILVIVVAIVTMQPSKKTMEVKDKPTTVTKVSKHSSHSSSKEKTSETSQTQEQPTQSEQAPSTQADGAQDTSQQAQEQYGYGGIPADSPEVAREQGQNEARQQWHDDQVEWGIQQGYLNPDGSPKETN